MQRACSWTDTNQRSVLYFYYVQKCGFCRFCISFLKDMLASPAGVNWVSDQCRLSLTEDIKRQEARVVQTIRPTSAKSGHNLCVLDISHMQYGFDPAESQPQLEASATESF